MAKFAIHTGGTFMGFFVGQDESAAIRAMSVDMGYSGTEEAAATVGKTVGQFVSDCYLVNVDDLLNAEKPEFDIADSNVDGTHTNIVGTVMIGNLRGTWTARVNNGGYVAAYQAGEEEVVIEYSGPAQGSTDNDVEMDEIGVELIERHIKAVHLDVFRYMQVIKARSAA